MKNIYVVVFEICVVVLAALSTTFLASAQEPTAKIQLAHNVADPLGNTLDIYINDELYLDNFEFRTATEFRDFVAGTELRIGIALASSQSPSDVIVNFAYTFVADSRNVLMISGVLSPTSFAANPDPNARPINISAHRIGDIRASGINSSLVDILMWHGSTDVGALDLYAGSAAELVSELRYGYASSYFNVIVGSVPLSVRRANGELIESYRGDFGSRSGQAIILTTSGFLNPAANENGPHFGLYVIDSEGGPFEPLTPQSGSERAFVQIVNNSADVDHTKFDVWVNNQRLVDDLEFRKATPYLQVIPDEEVTISITDHGAQSTNGAFAVMPVTLSKALHLIVINGLVSTSGYAANADPNAKPLALSVQQVHDLKPGTSPDHLDMLFVNGTTDSRPLDITIDGESFASNLSFGSVGAYTSLLPDPKLVVVTSTPGPGEWRALYAVDFTAFAGKAITAITTGFVQPEQNKGGAFATIMLVFDDGTTLVLRDVNAGVKDDELASSVRLAPNPTSGNATIAYELRADGRVRVSVYDAIGVRVSQSEKGLQHAGMQQAAIECSTLSSGMYNVVIEAGDARTMIPLWIVR